MTNTSTKEEILLENKKFTASLIFIPMLAVLIAGVIGGINQQPSPQYPDLPKGCTPTSRSMFCPNWYQNSINLK